MNKRFSDDKQWARVIRGVPIFVPHTRTITYADGTKKVIRIGYKDLEEIVRNMLRSQTQWGTAWSFQEGHTLPHQSTPQRHQPDTLAFARNPRLGVFGPSHTPAILVDQYCPSENMARIRQLPYRSVEYDEDNKMIKAIALLKTPPRLDLGVMGYATHRTMYLYEANHNSFHFFGGDMDSLNQNGNSPSAMDPSFQEMCYNCIDKYMAEKYPNHSDMYQYFMDNNYQVPGGGAAPAMPGPLNPNMPQPTMPGGAAPDATPPLPIPPPPQPGYSYGIQVPQVRKPTSDVETLQRENEQLRRQAAYSAALADLKSQGLPLDMTKEMQYAVTLTPEQFQHHIDTLAEMHSRYQSPATVPLLYGDPGKLPDPQPPKQTKQVLGNMPENYDAIIETMQAEGLTYEEAYAKLNPSANGKVRA